MGRIRLQNYRACKDVDVPLAALTAIVGYNNAGKSTILNGIEWFMCSGPLTDRDFNELSHPIAIEGQFVGINRDALEPNLHATYDAYQEGNSLIFRRTMASPGTATTAKLDLIPPAALDASAITTPAARVVQELFKSLMCDVVRIRAMEDAADDVSKVAKSNTLGRLVAKVVESMQASLASDYAEKMKPLSALFSQGQPERAAALVAFEADATNALQALFPGLTLHLQISLPTLTDLLKTSSVKVSDTAGGASSSARDFLLLGHGAQRCIQMALITHLAALEKSGSSRSDMILLDEPELYLHPHGIEQVRLSLLALSNAGTQIILSTHSPQLLHPKYAPSTIVVNKTDSRGTQARKSLRTAIEQAIDEEPAHSDLLFELGRASEIFFTDKVLLFEGKTETVLIPVLHSKIRGKSPIVESLGLVALGGCGAIVPCKKILTAMGIAVKVVADLDFVVDPSLLEIIPSADRASFETNLSELKRVLSDLSASKPSIVAINATTGWPTKSSVTTAAKGWVEAGKSPTGKTLIENVLTEVEKLGIWLWPVGDMEEVLGMTSKKHPYLVKMAHRIEGMDQEQAVAEFPEVKKFLDWLHR